ncbi:MAG: phosphoribosylformylglycinamidine cyclo-ligase [Clostridium sp.]|mgnify:CR=1 FL=1|nr:phosphoribosylformylglycinamidine cyclo-ligase [Clostridium sp.]
MTKYKDAGVDVEAGYEAVKLMRNDVKRTFRPEVLRGLGGFAGLFALDKHKYEEPVLVSGTDGVGTKLKIAFLMDKHDTIGMDCVAMCVNDIVCTGAEPLFFLDYIAMGKNYPEKVAQIVKGVADACVESGCALVGGETAEMPGFYPEDEYDLAGFAVGIVEKNKIIDGKNIKEGNKVIGLASSGIHSNGYSLVRKVLAPNKEKLSEVVKVLGTTIGEEIIKPTRIYVKTILELKEKFKLNGVAHITGGGFIENLPRIMPEGLGMKVFKGSWPVLPIFDLLQSLGSLNEKDMYNTFNMGIGMAIIVDEHIAGDILKDLNKNIKQAYLIGEVVSGGNGLELC